MFSSIDVTASTGGDAKAPAESQDGSLLVALLRRMLAQQDKTNDLLQELIQQGRLQQQARQTELDRWKQANPELAKSCRDAVDVLSDVQNEFLQSLTNEVDENEYSLRDSDTCCRNSWIAMDQDWHISTESCKYCPSWPKRMLPESAGICKSFRILALLNNWNDFLLNLR